jgi:proline dehydrogenase
VKGTYIEGSKIAVRSKSDVRKRYLELLKFYMMNGKFVEIATHDKEIIEDVNKFISKNKINKRRYSFELLYGCHNEVAEELLNEGYPVRIYLPYGKNQKGYVQRRLGQC